MTQPKPKFNYAVVSPQAMERIRRMHTRAVEPRPEDIGQCRRCDVDISLPDAPKGLCAVCAGAAR